MKKLFIALVALFFLAAGCSDLSKHASPPVAFKIASDSTTVTYIICTASTPISYYDTGVVDGKRYIVRDGSEQNYLINDSVIVKDGDLTALQVLDAYAHPETNLFVSKSEKLLESKFIYFGFFKQKTVSESLNLSRYNPSAKTIICTVHSNNETKNVFYFWSLIILFLIFCLGNLMFNTIKKIKDKEKIIKDETLKEIRMNFALVLSYLFLLMVFISAINSAFTHGWQFSLVSLFVFLAPALIKLYPFKRKTKATTK